MDAKSLKEWLGGHMAEEGELRLRYIGWDHRQKYFSPQKLDKEGVEVLGKLDNGEKVSFPFDSDFWVHYEEGMENSTPVF